ncbi:MAG: hypothetical protein U1C74_14740 [Phenylobacterium sp.]|nr:hypothetical protein [Phenylobacterium sp.]
MLLRDLLTINQHIYVQCHRPGCERRVRLGAAQACETIGPDVPVPGLGRRLRCGTCGARGRDGLITTWPCTLDWSAHTTREQWASAARNGDPVPWDLEEELATLRQLLGDHGELGGDGPVQWPVDGRSKGG